MKVIVCWLFVRRTFRNSQEIQSQSKRLICVSELGVKYQFLEDRSVEQGERRGSLFLSVVFIYRREQWERAAVEFSIGAFTPCDLPVCGRLTRYVKVTEETLI